MSLLKNKKAVEGLPLKYIIIALVAAICVGIALQFTGVLKTGILSTAEKINESTSTQTACALDAEEPLLSDVVASCVNINDTVSVSVKITDDCGIDSVAFDVDNDGEWIDLTLESGTKTDGTWSVTDYKWPSVIGSSIKLELSAFDNAGTQNQGKYTNTSVSCS